MRNRRLIMSAIVALLLLSMAMTLIACGPTKDPKKVMDLITKGSEKANFTMIIYDEDTHKPFMSMKFAGNKAEMCFEGMKTVVEEKDNMRIAYLIGEDGKVEKSEEPIVKGDTIRDMMNDLLEDIKGSEFVYSERLGGFVPKEEEGNELNTTYAILEKNVLTAYDGDNVVAVFKDVGKTKVEIPKLD